MKRIVLVALLAVALVGLAFAGGSPETEGTTTLTVWDFKYGEDTWSAAMDEVNALFEAENPDITIEMVAQPEPQYYDLVRATLATGEGPDIGLFHAQSRTWELSEGLVTLDDWVEEYRTDIAESAWAASAAFADPANGIKLVPMTVSGMGFYYNRAILAEAGVTEDATLRTPDGFRQALEAIQETGYRPIVWGNAEGFHLDWIFRPHVGAMLGEQGVKGFANGSTSFADPRIVEVVEYFAGLRADGLLDDLGASTPLFMDSLNQFMAGDGAFFFGLTSDIAHWQMFGEALGSDNVGFFPVINFENAAEPDAIVLQGAGIGYGVLSYSEKDDAAARYLEYLASAEVASILTNRLGVVSPNLSASPEASNFALDQIMSYIQSGAITPMYAAYMPGSALSTLHTMNQLLFNSQEISPMALVEAVQREIEVSR